MRLPIKLQFCSFRWKPYALNFGGQGGSGTNFEWLGIRLSLWWRFD